MQKVAPWSVIGTGLSRSQTCHSRLSLEYLLLLLLPETFDPDIKYPDLPKETFSASWREDIHRGALLL